MTSRPRSTLLLTLAAAAAGGVGFLVSRAAFAAVLQSCFPSFTNRLAAGGPSDAVAAADAFALAVALALAAVPLAILAVEWCAVPMRLRRGLLKVAAVGLLAAGLGLFYQHQLLASLDRQARRMPHLFPPGGPAASYARNPLTPVAWLAFGSVALFGAVDGVIEARRRRRRVPAGIAPDPGAA